MNKTAEIQSYPLAIEAFSDLEDRFVPRELAEAKKKRSKKGIFPF